MKKLFLAALISGSSLSAFSFSGNVDSATFYLGKAVELSQARKVWEADKNFQKALFFNPTSDEIRLAYADYLVENRKYFPAVEQVGKVLEKNLNNPVALQKMTDLSFQLRRWNDVVLYGNKLAQTGGGNKVKYMLGKSYYELENYGQAQRFLNDAFNENPKHTEAVTLLGKVYIELSNYKQAIAVYNKTLELDPNNNQLIYELGLLYYAMNNEKEAAKYFEVAAEKGYKTDLDYYENLGLAQLSFDINKGVATLNKVLEMRPGNPEILFQVAQAYYKVEKFAEAATTYTKIFETDPSNSRALYMSGVAYQKKGDKSKGIALCEQAIRMDPNLAQLKSAKSIF
ncbi:tetratricopeptide repeat protein [Aridibaculum aurantiacum]|uniref:tetratricopeptide repeat protein n=1 Tax=Aridibaculum aurantiacum TaxID=2810307 RepID=UPI001A95F1AE|nr:tetratricopeptide repeat protein [Aridibaculum aurantiacum]